MAEALLGSSCLVKSVAPETSLRANLSSFKIAAWTANLDDTPSLRWLAVPKLGLVAPPAEPPLLQYNVLIHLDAVTSYSEVEEP